MENLSFREQEWDSEQLGVRCGQVFFGFLPENTDQHFLIEKTKEIISAHSNYDMIFFKIPDVFAEFFKAMVREGADYIGSEIVFRHDPGGRRGRFSEVNNKPGVDILFQKTVKYKPFLALADEMKYSRFYLDARIDHIRASKLWRNSITNYCCGRADMLAVAYVNGLPAGLITINFIGAKRINLHIVGVLKNYRNLGIGYSMLVKVIEKYGDSMEIFVEAISANKSALRLYGKSGFVVSELKYVMHYWRYSGNR